MPSHTFAPRADACPAMSDTVRELRRQIRAAFTTSENTRSRHLMSQAYQILGKITDPAR